MKRALVTTVVIGLMAGMAAKTETNKKAIGRLAARKLMESFFEGQCKYLLA